MTPTQKIWFRKNYPNSGDYVKFFLQNDEHFLYDCITGNVSLRTAPERPFVRPERLNKLADICSDSGLNLREMSQNVSEVELFIVILKTFEEIYQLNKTIELTARQLREQLVHDKYKLMFKQISKYLANPRINGVLFEIDLMSYLSDNYSEVFDVDKHLTVIRLESQVVKDLKNVKKCLDDPIYQVFEYLLIKYIETKGPKDVDLLYDSFRFRHPFIVDYIFANSEATDEFTLLDFCEFNQNTFRMNIEEDLNGKVLRVISVRKPEVIPKSPTPEPYESDDEIYVSDNEIYESD